MITHTNQNNQKNARPLTVAAFYYRDLLIPSFLIRADAVPEFNRFLAERGTYEKPDSYRALVLQLGAYWAANMDLDLAVGRQLTPAYALEVFNHRMARIYRRTVLDCYLRMRDIRELHDCCIQNGSRDLARDVNEFLIRFWHRGDLWHEALLALLVSTQN